mmetsp:Transcript_11792/g.17293  ORF Transcript_11792/g.17293 Transcript_11792/m.17293 type:complete len:297 (+) Transcript_11792:42-932(+)|eukprot:CAMPEP_0194212226 /NCGR_PEP_ID=MMETSP0156-20130528/11929_1 /TAXON_ID=33649 /ORGANISM="Thalassionema nitzschioides, Strain L26-B" /LENGTH=296 /DNA_ID=CAMNT_0038939997 /DNA_START=37 /DNA_END=927 /DNA_ORIENTATION=-
MGNSQPTNKTGRKVVQQKLENASKTNILSLREHNLDSLPDQVFLITNLKTLDISSNELKSLSDIGSLKLLKSLNCDDNKLGPGSMEKITSLTKLQILRAGGNTLGRPISDQPKKDRKQNPKPTPMKKSEALPSALPSNLKQIVLDRNYFSTIPPSLLSSKLQKLEKLDLSSNQLVTLPSEISNLSKLEELKLDNNKIAFLPDGIGQLACLKTLSLKNNVISTEGSALFSSKRPQPLPASLFIDTLLIDLNLHGNPMTSTQLNDFEGYSVFLDRRQKVKTKDIYGGAMTSFGVCGLK